MSARQPEPERLSEIRERIRTRLVSYWDTSDADATRLLDAFAATTRAAVLDEAAGDFEARVPPVTAGPLTDRDRGLRYAAAELRRMAAEARDAQTGGAS